MGRCDDFRFCAGDRCAKDRSPFFLSRDHEEEEEEEFMVVIVWLDRVMRRRESNECFFSKSILI